MKIVVFNGSPRKEKSCTMRLTDAFLDGMRAHLDGAGEPCEIERVNIEDLHIIPCRGCLSCWGRTAGRCVIEGDDALGSMQKILAADVVVGSFPLHFCGMPGPMKTWLDRLLPLVKTYLGGNLRDGEPLHGMRYDMSGKKLVLVSCCGYGEVDPMYDAVRAQFDGICGKGKYTPLFCAQGETLRVSGDARMISVRLSQMREAGREFAATGSVSAATIETIAKPMFSQKTFRTLLTEYFEKGHSKA